MKIIQSFWTKPLRKKNDSSLDNRIDGGWIDMRRHLFSWCLTSLRLQKTYGHIELVTDGYGKFLFLDCLNLPYSKVTTRLDDIDSYPTQFWALGKLYTYSIQKEHFLHIDGDVYIWGKLPTRIRLARVAAQSIEYNHKYYNESLREIRSQGCEVSLLDGMDYANIISSNLGIVGGSDIKFFKDLSKISFDFIDRYSKELNAIGNPGLANVVFEQLFFTRLAEQRNIRIEYLFRSEDPPLQKLVRFHTAPKSTSYVHMVGRDFKKNFLLCKQIENTLRSEFPNRYLTLKKQINELCILKPNRIF